MPRLTLYALRQTQFFHADRGLPVVYRHERSPACFTAVHGTCDWNNGEHGLPGAYDTQAERHAITLPKPLLTGIDRRPNRHGWCVGDLAIADAGNGVFDEGSLVQFFFDDDTSIPCWALVHGHTCHHSADGESGAYAHYDTLTRIALPEILTMSDTQSPLALTTGMYIRCRDVDKAIFETFARACLDAGARSYEYPRYQQRDFHFFGWRPHAGLYYGDTPSAFGPQGMDVTAFFDGSRTPVPPVTHRVLFERGDKVIATGFKAPRRDGDTNEHFFGSNSTMRRWVRDSTVLTVTDTRMVRNPSVPRISCCDGRDTYQFHPSELRVATPEEITPPPTLPVAGSVVRQDDKVYIVIRDRVDSDGDMRMFDLQGRSRYLRVRGSQIRPYEVLGQLMADGDFRPATADMHPKRPLVGLKRGDKVRCIDQRDYSYVTRGQVYTLREPVTDPSERIVISDNDGDRAQYRQDAFEAA